MAEIPASAPKPQDRKPKKKAAVAAEADGFIDIELERHKLTLRVPLGEQVPLTAYIAFRDGDEMRGTELLLGAEQWAAFMAVNPTVGDFAEVGKKLSEVVGN